VKLIFLLTGLGRWSSDAKIKAQNSSFRLLNLFTSNPYNFFILIVMKFYLFSLAVFTTAKRTKPSQRKLAESTLSRSSLIGDNDTTRREERDGNRKDKKFILHFSCDSISLLSISTLPTKLNFFRRHKNERKIRPRPAIKKKFFDGRIFLS
jgi:hypothetical protein